MVAHSPQGRGITRRQPPDFKDKEYHVPEIEIFLAMPRYLGAGSFSPSAIASRHSDWHARLGQTGVRKKRNLSPLCHFITEFQMVDQDDTWVTPVTPVALRLTRCDVQPPSPSGEGLGVGKMFPAQHLWQVPHPAATKACSRQAQVSLPLP